MDSPNGKLTQCSLSICSAEGADNEGDGQQAEHTVIHSWSLGLVFPWKDGDGVEWFIVPRGILYSTSMHFIFCQINIDEGESSPAQCTFSCWSLLWHAMMVIALVSHGVTVGCLPILVKNCQIQHSVGWELHTIWITPRGYAILRMLKAELGPQLKKKIVIRKDLHTVFLLQLRLLTFVLTKYLECTMS